MKRLLNRTCAARPVSALFCVVLSLCTLPCTAFAANAAASVGKTGNMSIIYGILFALSFLLLLGYCFLVKQKTIWLVLLYISVFVVNGGYLGLSLAKDLEGALLANQVSYFGAAMLPLAMLMIIINTCRIKHPKWVTVLLVLVSLAAFLLAASGGYSDLYYKDVWVVEINGVCCLQKVYGPLHFLYTVYLFVYFGMMIAAIVYSYVKKTIMSCKYVVFLASAVFGNLIIWFVEQLVHVNFEFLSVSYIVTELLMLLIYSLFCDYGIIRPEKGMVSVQMLTQLNTRQAEVKELPAGMENLFDTFARKVKTLSSAEQRILHYYIDGYEISEIPDLAFISINTVKKHNRSIYQKLEIASRDELMLYIELFRCCGRLDELKGEPAESQ